MILTSPCATKQKPKTTCALPFTETITIMQEVPMEPVRTSTSTRSSASHPPESSSTVPQVSRSMEASALSALLVPGGQVPAVPVSNANTRPLGRPTITKVPSPYTEDSKTSEKVEKLLAKEDNHLSGSSVDEAVKLIEDNDFNWYFRHYNDTDVEPFVGIVYGGSLASSTASSCGATILGVYAYWAVIRYLVWRHEVFKICINSVREIGVFVLHGALQIFKWVEFRCNSSLSLTRWFVRKTEHDDFSIGRKEKFLVRGQVFWNQTVLGCKDVYCTD